MISVSNIVVIVITCHNVVITVSNIVVIVIML